MFLFKHFPFLKLTASLPLKIDGWKMIRLPFWGKFGPIFYMSLGLGGWGLNISPFGVISDEFIYRFCPVWWNLPLPINQQQVPSRPLPKGSQPFPKPDPPDPPKGLVGFNPASFFFQGLKELLGGGNSKIFGIFTPKIGGRFPIWLAYFSDGLVQPPARLAVSSTEWFLVRRVRSSSVETLEEGPSWPKIATCYHRIHGTGIFTYILPSKSMIHDR